MHEDLTEVLYSRDAIARRVAEIGAQITRDYADAADDDGIVVLCVLRGAAVFAADLVRCIELPVEMDFMAVSSYGCAAETSGEVRILKDAATDIEGRRVIVVEDILDSGLTLSRLVEMLAKRKPASLSVAVLLRKRVDRQLDPSVRYVGFECPEEFVVGYGLDFAERYRNLPYIGVLKSEIYK